jgi:hypothetical protein
MIMVVSYLFWGFMTFCILCSILSAIAAVTIPSWLFMILSAIAFFPFVGYFNGYPRFEGSIFLLFFHVVSMFSIMFKKYRIAWVSLTPSLIFTVLVFN